MEFEEAPNEDAEVYKMQRRQKSRSPYPFQPQLLTGESLKLDYFENPVTSEKFEYAATPLQIRVIQESVEPQAETEEEQKEPPTQIHDRVKHIVCGDNHTLALTEQGNLWAWGMANQGQLGVIKQNASMNLLLTKHGQYFSSLPLPVSGFDDEQIDRVYTKSSTCYAVG